MREQSQWTACCGKDHKLYYRWLLCRKRNEPCPYLPIRANHFNGIRRRSDSSSTNIKLADSWQITLKLTAFPNCFTVETRGLFNYEPN